MNARTFGGCAAAYFVFAATAAVLSTDAPRALAQSRAASSGVRVLWSPDRPPGVPPDRWIRINGSLGIVIAHPRARTTLEPGEAVPPSLEGYFALYHAGRWWRLRTNVGTLTPLAGLEAAPPGAHAIVDLSR